MTGYDWIAAAGILDLTGYRLDTGWIGCYFMDFSVILGSQAGAPNWGGFQGRIPLCTGIYS